MKHYLGAMFLAVALAGSSAACAGHVRVYEGPVRASYSWDSGEERFYRAYLAQRRQAYIEFRRLSRRDQDRYWEWRRSNRDSRDRDRDYRRDRDRDRDRR